MNNAIASVSERLLHAKFALERLSLMKTFQALCLLDQDVKDEFEEICALINQSRSITITFVEAVKNDRRQKRLRYKKNRKMRMSST